WLLVAYPPTARRYEPAEADSRVSGDEDQGRRLFVPQRDQWRPHATCHLGRLRTAREGTIGRALQEGHERCRRGCDSERLGHRSKPHVVLGPGAWCLVRPVNWKTGDYLTHRFNPELGIGRVTGFETRALVVEF